MVHIVYTDNTGKAGIKELDKIMSGEKTMVIRSAAGRKIPHSRVFAGEQLYFMEKGSASITASAVVTDVQNYVKLSEDEINMDDWLIVDKVEDVLVGTSIPYNYEKSKL